MKKKTPPSTDRSPWPDWSNGWFGWSMKLLIVMLATTIFALRFTPAFHDTNFYAEDGRVFTQTVLQKNPAETILTGFNGYLVAGQYALVEAAVAANTLLGDGFEGIPVKLAFVSCLFLGLTVSLPFLLLRKQLGTKLSLSMVLIGALTPLPSSDYAIIGTIGNLKFAALYWVFILVLFRNYNVRSKRAVFAADGLMLYCILTYAPAVALAPFAAWPYRQQIMGAWRSRKPVRLLKDRTFASLILLGMLAAIYLAVVFLRGIPPQPGYLDGPYQPVATMKLLFHSTWYTWLFPVVEIMRDRVVIGLAAAMLYVAFAYRQNRFVGAFALWSILVATASFAVNRPGISEYFLRYGHGPDQFFYAQRLVFMFMTMWFFGRLLAGWKLRERVLALISAGTFVLLLVPFTGSFGHNSKTYEAVGSIKENVSQACLSKDKIVKVQTYPSDAWVWQVDRDIACR
jgi:hypothetical protein